MLRVGEPWCRCGCGKSTLIDLLGGLSRPTGGQVLVDGRPVTGSGSAPARRSCSSRTASTRRSTSAGGSR
ncbi:ATP-binding cassette domain-containing protein [Micromonospora sp. NPDC047620]|uniref:ATP-binding cassette domain-containing protein n=1 Tax=Micromonospora sp. NPDC047620 TaxID=3364251 RepID=UPI003713A806